MKFVQYFLFFPGLFFILMSCASEKEESAFAPACDTAFVSYSQSIVPILEAHCYRCHSKEAASLYAKGNVLEGYENISGYIKGGLVIGNIRHDPGFKPMPRYDLKLPPCDIATFQKWAQEGLPNN